MNDIITTFKKNDYYMGPKMGIYPFKFKEPIVYHRWAEMEYDLDEMLLIDDMIVDEYLLDIFLEHYDRNLHCNQECVDGGLIIENCFHRFGYKNYYTFNQIREIVTDVEGVMNQIRNGNLIPEFYDYLEIKTENELMDFYERFIAEMNRILDEQNQYDGVVIEAP